MYYYVSRSETTFHSLRKVKLIAVCMCAEASALQFSWQAGQSWQTRPAWVSKGFLKAVVVSDASAALVVLPTLSSLVSDGAGKVAAAATTSHRHRPPSDLDPPPRC